MINKKIHFIVGFFVLIGFIYLVSALEEISTVTLNSTLGINSTNEDLTAYPNPFNSSQKYIYNWKKDGTSVMIFNTPFEGSSNNTFSKDYVLGNNFSSAGSATYNSTGGYDGKGAYEFDGATEYMRTPSAVSGDFRTIEFWLNENSILTGDDGNNEMPLAFGVGTDKWITLGGCTSGIAGETVCIGNAGATAIKDTVTQGWHHHAIVWNGASYDFYMDGIQRTTYNNVGSDADLISSQEVVLGRRLSGTAWWFSGAIDEVRIYNVSLSPEQILALYNNRTDLIVSNETSINDTWQSCVTPNDGSDDGNEVCSNNLTVLNICTCPSSPQNWNVNMANNCVLNSVCNITGYDLTFYGAGNFTINNTLYVNELKNISSGMTVWMKPEGIIYNE